MFGIFGLTAQAAVGRLIASLKPLTSRLANAAVLSNVESAGSSKGKSASKRALPASKEEDHTPRKSHKSSADDESGKANGAPKISSTRPNRARKAKQRGAWRCVPEAAGSTYTFAVDDPNATRWIGTRGLHTCVGVYFAIDPQRCFVGHFNFDHWHPDDGQEADDNPERSTNDYICNNQSAFSMFQRVANDMLSELQDLHQWGPVTDLMRGTLVMVSPHADLPDATYTGDAVVQGVNEFLGLEEAPVRPENNEAFMVLHTGSSPASVMYFDGELPEDRSNWRTFMHDDNDFCAYADVTRDGVVMTERGTVAGDGHPAVEDGASAGLV